jgi:formate hydrogenlyase subunit 6/NADH:ubiquinone oxidoreductase subunit I
VNDVRTKMPWIDREMCDIAETCEECKAARLCKHGAFQVMPKEGDNGSTCRVGIDFEKCRFCGDCSHTCDRGAVRMV